MEILKSAIDNSVNFITQVEVGKFESRFVQRQKDYFISYLSSQSGCNQACRMCHLTATKQTKFVNAEIFDYVNQNTPVMQYYKLGVNSGNENATTIHYNFMARGEPLDNETMVYDNDKLFPRLHIMAAIYNLKTKFKISTILPKSLEQDNYALYRLFEHSLALGHVPDFYYSLYSMDENFRKLWLPKALPAMDGLMMLKGWQEKTNLIPKIHFAFIKDQNDSLEDMFKMCNAIEQLKLKVRMNIVRYNTYSEIYGKESDFDIIERNVDYLQTKLNIDVKIIPRVGTDVYASCGSFYPKGNKNEN